MDAAQPGARLEAVGNKVAHEASKVPTSCARGARGAVTVGTISGHQREIAAVSTGDTQPATTLAANHRNWLMIFYVELLLLYPFYVYLKTSQCFGSLNLLCTLPN